MKLKIMLLTTIICVLAIPAAAQAATFTLDGKVVGVKGVASATGGCAMFPDANNVTACFSSEAKRAAKIDADVNALRIPPGYTVFPSAQELSQDRGTASVSSASTAKKPKRNIAHTSGCGTANHAWSNPSKGGTYWYSYNTAGWHDLPSGSGQPDNKIGSDETASGYHTYYSDGYNGGAPQFNVSYPNCHYDSNLGSLGRPGGGTWLSKFSSIYSS